MCTLKRSFWHVLARSWKKLEHQNGGSQVVNSENAAVRCNSGKSKDCLPPKPAAVGAKTGA